MIIYVADDQGIFIASRDIDPMKPVSGGLRFSQTPPPELTGSQVAHLVYGKWEVLESRPPAPPPPEPPPTPPKEWTGLEFKRLFTPEERVGMRVAAKSDPIIEDFLDLLDTTAVSGSRIVSNDPDLKNGLGYMVLTGLLTQDRMTEILNV